MRKMTSAEIAKTIKGLDHECAQLLQREREACVYRKTAVKLPPFKVEDVRLKK